MEINNKELIINNKFILKINHLLIHEKSITCITGESGCGKTSLLNELSQYTHNMNMCFDVDKRKDIAYMRQKHELIPSLTVKENIDLYLEIANEKFDENLFHKLDKTLCINHLLNKFPRQLSVGEKSRTNLLMLIMKKPQYLILDEPTAALNNEYIEKIITLLTELKNSMTIIIATHQKKVIDIADYHYDIKNKELILCNHTTHNIPSSYSIQNNNQLKKFNNLKWTITLVRNKTFSQFFVSLLFSVIMATLVIAIIIKNTALIRESDLLNKTSNNEILVMNTNNPNVVYDYSVNVSAFDTDIYNQINQIDGIEVNPCYIAYSSYDNVETGTSEKEQIDIYKDNKKILSKDTYNYDGTEIKIFPYFSYTQLSNSIYGNKKENGIYISKSLYEYLQLADIDDVELKLSEYLLLYYHDASVETETGESWPFAATYGVKTKATFLIDGVLEDVDGGSYHGMTIYVPYELLKEKYMKYQNLPEKTLKITDQEVYQEKPYTFGVLSVYCENFADVPNIIEKIHKINPNLTILSFYNDVESKLKYYNNFIAMTNIYIAVGFIFYILMSLGFHIFDRNKNRNLHHTLSNWGLNTKNNKTFYFMRLVFDYLIQFILCLIMTGIILLICNLLQFDMIIQSSIILYITGICIISYIIKAIVERIGVYDKNR